MIENEIAKQVVDAAFKIHCAIGPGLLESVYEVLLAHELRERALKVEQQLPIPITYGASSLSRGFVSICWCKTW